MAGDWVGSLRMRYTRVGEAPRFDEKPFALKLDGVPASLGGAASPCDLRAIPEGDSVRFPVGQRCVGSLNDTPFGTTLRDGTLRLVDGKLQLALVFDADNGDELVVDGSLARRM